MLTRTLVASALPRGGRLRPARPRFRALVSRLVDARQRSLLMQERADALRVRTTDRHGLGRR